MPVITPLYAAVAALMLIALSARVIGMRRRRRVSIGDGEDEILALRIRAHGNFIEYVPMALVLLLLLELGGASAWLLHGLGIALLAGRLVHAWSLGAHNGTGRIIGMGLTFGVLAVAAIRNLEAALGVAIFG